MIPSVERDFIVAQIELRKALVAANQCQQKLARAKEQVVQDYLQTKYPDLGIDVSCRVYASAATGGPILGNTLYLTGKDGKPVIGPLLAEVNDYLAKLEVESLP